MGEDLLENPSIYEPGVHHGSALSSVMQIMPQSVHQRRCKKTAEPTKTRRIILPVERNSLHAALINKRTINGNILHRYNWKNNNIKPSSPLQMLEKIEAIKCQVEDKPTTVTAASNLPSSIRKGSMFEPEKCASIGFFEAKRFSHLMST